ncbi:MAG: hypothetical protein RLY97_531 [Pseudomonadota bacterium]
MHSLQPNRRTTVITLLLVMIFALIELAMHRPVICPCGTIKFWWSAVQSAENSQHIADWYSFSHVIHGTLFYACAHILRQKSPLFQQKFCHWALAIAVMIEGIWELLENSPTMIDRYRSVTISYGYTGDSIVNSMADIGWMSLGFLLAARLPVRATVTMAVSFELFTLLVIRDNLTLNILMLIWPINAIRLWQGAI